MRQQKPQPKLRRPRSWWTPRRVVTALTWYPELASTVEAGMIAPGGDEGGATIWEPGSAMEKLALRKADIDQALRRVKQQCAAAVRIYYLEGQESHAAVAREMHISKDRARKFVRLGVPCLAIILCDRLSAGSEALHCLDDVLREKSASKTRDFQQKTTPCVIQERDLACQLEPDDA